MESKPNLAKAVIAVMKSVKGIDKTMTIGSGNNSYKGVPDQEVKKVIGDSMAANGLTILPIGVEAKTQIDRWEEVDQYSKSTPKDMKTKQSVFTEVTTKYLLLHESGESIELSGYGHGIDTQDKGAGKATTYALKYTLLYMFLVPTGKIDDSDNTHSDGIDTPAVTGKTTTAENSDLPWLNETDAAFKGAVEKIKAGKSSITALRQYFKISKAIEQKIKDQTELQHA